MNTIKKCCLYTACALALPWLSPSVYAMPADQPKANGSVPCPELSQNTSQDDPLAIKIKKHTNTKKNKQATAPADSASQQKDTQEKDGEELQGAQQGQQQVQPEQQASDPKEERIKLLEQQLQDQKAMIEQLQSQVNALIQSNTAQSPAQSPAQTTAEAPIVPDSSTQTAAANEEESEDPGPTPPEASEATTASASQGSEQQPEMNPNISLIVLGGAQSGGQEGDPNKDSFFIREAELAISAPVDPYTKLEAYVAFPKDEHVELEEAYATYSKLPGGLQLRGGLMRNEFGRLNNVHEHALPQIDRPLPLTQVFGEEGLRSPGIELSWLAPTPWYAKAIVQVGTRYGEAEDGEYSLFPTDGSHNPLLVARLENMVDLNPDTTLMLGLSHASSSINNGIVRDSNAFGVDLTLKWSPTGEQYRNLTWQSEYLTASQNYVDPETERLNLKGWYSYLSYRFNKTFRAGVRYDESDVADVEDGRIKRVSGILEFIANEWNALQLQYNHCMPTYGKNYDELLLQWNLVVGPHGSHKY